MRIAQKIFFHQHRPTHLRIPAEVLPKLDARLSMWRCSWNLRLDSVAIRQSLHAVPLLPHPQSNVQITSSPNAHLHPPCPSTHHGNHVRRLAQRSFSQRPDRATILTTKIHYHCRLHPFHRMPNLRLRRKSHLPLHHGVATLEILGRLVSHLPGLHLAGIPPVAAGKHWTRSYGMQGDYPTLKMVF